MAWGALPLGGILAGLCGSVIGIRASLAIAVSGYWSAGLLVYFSPLRSRLSAPRRQWLVISATLRTRIAR